MSNVAHAYYPDERTLRVSVTDDRAKTRNLRRDPRASYHVTGPDRRAYTVVEGVAELSPVARDPHDETVEELIRLYRDVLGEHPDWDDFRAAMVRDRRLVLRLRVERAYGIPRVEPPSRRLPCGSSPRGRTRPSRAKSEPPDV